LELKPEQIAGLLGKPGLSKVSQELQQNLIKKVLPAILENPGWLKENPKLIEGLAKRARISGFQFSRSELEKLVFEQHAFAPEFVKPILSQDPKAAQKVLDLAKSHSDPKVQIDAFKAVNDNQAHLAQTVLTQLSQSGDPKDLLRAARFYMTQNKGEPAEVVNRLLEKANDAELTELSRVLRWSKPDITNKLNLDGLKPERLTELGQWASADDDLGRLIYPVVLSRLVSVSPSAGSDLAKAGLKAGFAQSQLTLDALDHLPTKEAQKLSGLAPQVGSVLITRIEELGKSLGQNKQDSFGLDLKGTKFLGNFPEAIKTHQSALKDFALGKSGPVENVAFSLLSLTGTPESRNFILERASQETKPMVGVSAARHLSQMLERQPELITPEIKKELSKMLQSQNGGDLTRLHLRQSLPPALSEQIDSDILSAQKQRLNKLEALGINLDDTVNRATTNAALQLYKEGKSNGSLGLGEQALALRYLVATEHPQAGRMVEKFLRDTSEESANPAGPMGYQHNLNQLQGLLTDARTAGLKIDPKLAAAVEQKVNHAVENIWNRGQPSKKFENISPDGTTSRDSNAAGYSVAAYLAGSIDPKNPKPTPTQRKMLDVLQQNEQRFPGAIPYDVVDMEKKEVYGRALDSAPTVGRTLSAATAQYLPIANLEAADSKEKEQRAQQILGLAKTYLTHFSQTHETPRNSKRAHDITPGGQEMAPYYGPSNDIHFAQAMRLIAEDPTLPHSFREQARQHSEEMRIRLLTHANNQGVFPQRSIENFPGENRAYQILMGLTLRNLPSRTSPKSPAPYQRILRSALK